MKSITSLILLLSAFSCVAEARVMYGKDVTVAPEKYFSTNAQGLDSAAILPPPPAVDSLLFAHDKAMYEQGLTLRDTPRGLQAAQDADVKHLHMVFSASF